jgi:hypothetical protein
MDNGKIEQPAVASRKRVKYFVYIAAVVAVFFTMLFFFHFVVVGTTIKNREWAAKNFSVKYNLQTVGKALQKYAFDHNGYLPSAEKWSDVLLQYDKMLTQNDFKHPKKPEIVIAFNKDLSGLRFADIPKDTVLLFETQGDWNLSGDESLVQTKNPKQAILKVLLVNMTIKSYWVEYKGNNENWRGRFEPMRWKP